jgi:ankyrin repeat protein
LQNGESALHAASLFGHLKVVKELIQSGAKVDLKNKDGYTAADQARQAGYEPIVQYFDSLSHPAA